MVTLARMRRVPIDSSSIRSVGYDSETQTMEIEFVSRGTYQYDSVPEFLYLSFMRSPSKGIYFNKHIGSRYRSREMKDTI